MGRKKKTVEKKVRPQLANKEELVMYIKNSPDELPFVEEVWQKAVAKAKENESLPVPTETVTTVDEYGNETTKKVRKGVRTTDPVGVYWSYMNLPQYRKKAEDISYEEEHALAVEEEFGEFYDGDDIEEVVEEPLEYNEIIAWINMFALPDERNYLKQRYAHYYDNYEINDGADRTMLNGILSLEIELYRVNYRRAKGQAVDIGREEKLRKMLRESLEAQKWTKKQRSAMDDMAQNAFTIWMERQAKNGKFTPVEVDCPKDDVDYLMEVIPEAVRKMLD